MKACRWGGVLLGALGWLALGGNAGAQPPDREHIVVRADRNLPHAVVRYRAESGDEAFHEAAGNDLPVSLQVAPGNYEVQVEAPDADSWFRTWRGSKPKILNGTDVTIPLHAEVNWRHVLGAGLPAVALLLGVMGLRVQRLKSDTVQLTDALDEARNEIGQYTSLKPGQLPKTIGHFKVLGRLGAGGMATVFHVEDEYGDKFALKVPDMHILENDELRERFFREMEIMRGLRHPSIVHVYEVHRGDSETVPYIAEEFVEGDTLRQLINREAPLQAEWAAGLIKSLAGALEYAHSKGIIHRDIKPANVMMTAKGEVRLMDFGIARATDMRTMTRTDVTLGTPQYMAPEQIDTHTATASADLYALGVVFFELLTGRLPFTEEDPYLLLTMKKMQTAPRVSSLRPDIEPRLDNLVALLLAGRPEDRPESAATVARMLDLVLETGA
jgi:hypothetical protein